MDNPFKPSFGAGPPFLVDRSDLLAELRYATNLNMWSPSRVTLYTGASGTGKTVMLNEAEDWAASQGWRVISEAANPGFVDRFIDNHFPKLLDELDPQPTSRITSISTPFGGGRRQISPDVQPRDFRTQLEAVIERLHPETGLMLTLDEVQKGVDGEMEAFSNAMQLVTRKEPPLAFVGAGLPHAVEEILADNTKTTTFLKRADKHVLRHSPIALAAEGIADPIRTSGRMISDVAALRAGELSQGYSYLIQLVGYHSYFAEPDNLEVTLEAVEAGGAKAIERLGEQVHAVAMRALSPTDKRFLKAMSLDDGPSNTRDLAERLDRSPSYVGQYRARLIAADLIESTDHGEVDISMPYLREHLRQRDDIKLGSSPSERARFPQVRGFS